VNEDISENIVSLVIPDGAHHSGPCGPRRRRTLLLLSGRGKEEKKHIHRWIHAYKQMDGQQSTGVPKWLPRLPLDPPSLCSPSVRAATAALLSGLLFGSHLSSAARAT